MRETQTQAHKILVRVFFELGSLVDGRTVTDTNEAEDGSVAFGDADDVALEVGPGRAWENGSGLSAVLGIVKGLLWRTRSERTPHLLLLLDVPVLDVED